VVYILLLYLVKANNLIILLSGQNITLVGDHVILRPPQSNDLEGLSDAAVDGEIWNNPYAFFPKVEDMSIYLQNMIKHDESFIPLIILQKETSKIIGTTRFFNIDKDNHRVEIGHTWIAQSFRKTVVNSESKFLMLQYAFEKLNCIAVEIRTDVLNEVSRKAIERLGARQDGILRNHKIMRDGRIRNTVCYSITRDEWPGVSQNIKVKISSREA
jgi:RimJ/RimL family protein N-acetyltransferase